ncbi:MAG: hypothetical protein QOE51_2777 [Actinoplanes sp.]|jgi:hypothetical protein|nr:hypothetical protein [Actinoplanes sp.]
MALLPSPSAVLSRVASIALSPSALVDVTRSAVGQVIETAAAVATVPVRVMSLLGQAELLATRITVIADSAESLIYEVTVIVAQARETVQSAQTIAAAAALTIEEASALTTGASRIVDEAAAITAEASRLVVVAEAVTAGASGVLEKAEQATAAAGVVLGDASAATGTATAVVEQAAAATAELVRLLDGYLPMLQKAAPLAGRFVDELSPDEVTAAIRMVDELPRLREHLIDDVMPLLGKLDQVGPDLHQLLGVTQDLHLAIAGLPGLKMLRRRGEERVTEEDSPTNSRKSG